MNSIFDLHKQNNFNFSPSCNLQYGHVQGCNIVSFYPSVQGIRVGAILMNLKTESSDQVNPLNQRDNEIIELILKGERAKNVALRMGITLERVRQILQREGVSYKSVRKGQKDLEFKQILEKAEQLATKLKRVPYYEDMKGNGIVLSMVAYRSLRDKMLGKGHEPAPRGRRKVSRDFLISELQKLYKKLGKLPSGEDLNKYASFSRHTYHAHFGSLKQAFKEAGLIS